MEQLAAGWWFRHESYEVRDGHIRPAPGAKIFTYDPWSEYWRARSGDARQVPALDALLVLLDEITVWPTGEDDPRYSLSRESEKKRTSCFPRRARQSNVV